MKPLRRNEANIMKIKLVAIVASFVAIPMTSFAAEIIFDGEVTTQTCSASINGSLTPTVLLDSANVNELASQGATAIKTPFQLTLSGCTPSAQGGSYELKFVPQAVTTNGNMKNSVEGNSNGATNVSLQILDSSSAPINLTANDSNNLGSITLGPNEDSATQTFYVQYYAENAGVTAGAVKSVASYTVRYE